MSIYNFGKNAKKEVDFSATPISQPLYTPWLMWQVKYMKTYYIKIKLTQDFVNNM